VEAKRVYLEEEVYEVFSERPAEANVEQPVPEQEFSKFFTSFPVENFLSLEDIELRSLLNDPKKARLPNPKRWI